jgi:disulfide bond formation protein DsbB
VNGARSEPDSTTPTRSSTGWVWLSAVWAVALVSSFAALFIGEVMSMAPCQLCWYQRVLMFPLAVILGMAAFGSDRRGAVYALPLALGGAAVAAYHTALVAGWVPKGWIPCGAGPSCSNQKLLIFGDIQIPWRSLLVFAAIVVFLLVYLRKTRA